MVISKRSILKKILLVSILLLPLIIRITNSNPVRVHYDEFITGYFSAHYDFQKTNFFSPIPPNRGGWVSQFPAPFFALQKLFFLVFGENLSAIRISILPYVLIVTAMLFLITRHVLNTNSAIIAVILYSYFAPSLYLETLGLHFISSTAVFLIFFYFLIINIQRNDLRSAILLGFSGGLSYLFYSSSYIAFPLMVLVFLIRLGAHRKWLILKNFALATASFGMVALPFLHYMYRADNFYLSQRIDQVNLISGEWSAAKDELAKSRNVYDIIRENFILSIQSLYKNGIGGHGGYNFGRLALLEETSLFLIAAGAFLSLFWLRKKMALVLVWLVILISFLTGMVLTIPPPAYHRFSAAFPFLIVIMSVFLNRLLDWKFLPKKMAVFIVLTIIIIYALNNYNYFRRQAASDTDQSLKLGNYIVENFPSRKIYIAAFPSYHLKKVFYFFPQPNMKEAVADYHQELLAKLNPNESYLYIILFPQDWEKKFQEADKNGVLIRFSNDWSLFFPPS